MQTYWHINHIFYFCIYLSLSSHPNRSMDNNEQSGMLSTVLS